MTELTKKSVTIPGKPRNIISEQILSAVEPGSGMHHDAIEKRKTLARKSFEKTGLPGPKDEEYRKTDIVSALNRNFDFTTDLHATSSVKDFEPFRQHPVYREKAYIIATVNGKMAPELCAFPDADSGITVTPMEEMANTPDEEAVALFGKIANTEADGFTALNTMLTDAGILLRIRDHARPELPVIIMNFTDSTNGKLILYPHNIIIAGKNSSVKIIELFDEQGENPVFRNTVTEIKSDELSSLHYYKLQNFGLHNFHVDNTSVHAQREASVNTYTFSFNGKVIRNNLNISLLEEHSEAHMFGLYIANDRSLIDNHTVVDHKAANCSSNEKYKGIMDDFSKGVFNGKIYVRPHAQKTNAFQSNHNILLCETAKIDAKPQLEIWADDVKCTHGCTTGQIDKNQLFYMRSRGISEHDARTLLLQAFASDILNEVTIPFLKAKISSLIKSRLHPKDI